MIASDAYKQVSANTSHSSLGTREAANARRYVRSHIPVQNRFPHIMSVFIPCPKLEHIQLQFMVSPSISALLVRGIWLRRTSKEKLKPTKFLKALLLEFPKIGA